MELTTNEKRVLEVIDYYATWKGYPPTRREIGRHLGKSESWIGFLCSCLQARGLIEQCGRVDFPEVSVASGLVIDRRARSRRLTELGRRHLYEMFWELKCEECGACTFNPSGPCPICGSIRIAKVVIEEKHGREASEVY